MRPGRARLLTLLLLLLPAAAPAALAQDPLAMRVEVEPFPHPARPLQGVVVTNVTVDAPCAAANASGDPTRPSIALWVEEAPRWSNVVLSPATLAPDPSTCQMGRLVQTAQLVATANDQAPAFSPAPVKVAATWVGATPNMTARGAADLSAGFFSILDVVLLESIQQVAPGESATFALDVANLGNDRVTVLVELVEAPEWLEPVVPGPVTLESKQKGGAATRADVPLTIHTKGDGLGYENTPGTVTYRIRSHHADRPDLVGDETTVTVLLTVKGFRAEASGPGLVPLVALVVVLAALAGRRLHARR